LFGGANNRLVRKGKKTRMINVPTDYGTISATVRFESEHRCVIQIQSEFFADCRPNSIEIILPFASRKVAASHPRDLFDTELRENSTIISCASVIKTLFVDL
jgi:hypothetical protein